MQHRRPSAHSRRLNLSVPVVSSDKLGAAVNEYLARDIKPRQRRYGTLQTTWQQLLPAELGEHCAITELSGCCMTVVTDSPAYLYRLHQLREELLQQLVVRSPRAGIRKIEFTLR